MKTLRPWQAAAVGVAVAVIAGTVLMVCITFPYFYQELGSFIVAANLVGFWGYTVVVTIPVAVISSRKKVPPRRVVLASVRLTAYYLLAVVAAIYVLPHLP